LQETGTAFTDVTSDSLIDDIELICLRSTALAFAYIESLAVCPDIEFAVASSLSMLESTKEKLKEAGIQELVYEDFYDEFVQLIQRMNENLDIKMKKSLLLAAFQNPDGIFGFRFIFQR
jgi:hypothetical protein